jgi:sensor histidine kinase regulating citrate/malate metabolism
LSIKFANNGSGLAEGMTEDSVFDYSQTSGNGEGIGGWHLREIVKQSHGSVILHYNPTAEDGFMIDYEIILPTI